MPTSSTPFDGVLNQVLHGDALAQLRALPAGLVDTVVTSPPYYCQRDYSGEHQLGLEETPEAYIDRLAARAVALGAAGYVLKDSHRDKLLDSIRGAATGETVWTREELRRVTGALATPRLSAEVEVPLTQRESEVLKQLALGLTNKEIAQALHISYETVKEHVQHILRKIGVTDRTQAAVWAVRKQLV